MRKILFIALAWIAVGITNIFAKGVLAGTEISNFSTLQYEINGVSYTTDSNTIIDKVDQVIDVNVVWNDASPIIVASGEINRVLTFKVTNTGNGNDTFSLTYDIANPSSDFIVTNPRIFIDTNNNGVFDVSIDQPVSSTMLAADAFATIFLVSDMPTSSYISGSISSNAIEAKSTIGGSSAPGTIYPGAGAGGVFAVDGMSGGVDKDWGKYEMSGDLGVKLTKSATHSGSEVSTGTIVSYNIVVELQANGSVGNLIITDAIPAGTTYVAGSLKLDGVSLTDASDSDSGRFTGTSIEVNLGAATQSLGDPYIKNISFDVMIS
ncbi:MAG: hypothetical protein WC253_01485 [Sulfurovaceae bacterium]|jgi:uncharacterized repeat protein (TIGR01451 family)